MRPLKLEMQAMGPYKQSEKIDFTRLGEKRFFLIHGPTGAGKTSILDAMTYALYGDSSGDERSLEQMRSQWADADTESFVIFDFSIGGKVYRIRRSPKQTLNRKRGSGTREVNAEATLWQIGDEASVIETGIVKVTEAVESLLGFNSGQFRQVIVLPQGKFRELLSAKAEGREEILKVLFGTERFTRIQEGIRERAGDARKRLESFGAERDAFLKGEDAASADELNARAASFKSETEETGELLKKLEYDEQAAQQELKSASLIEAAFAERDSAAESLKKLEEMEGEIGKHSERIDAGRKAIGFSDFYKALTDERGLFSDLEMKLKISSGELSEAEQKKNAAEKIYREIPGKRDELKSAESELRMLEQRRDIYSEIAKIDGEMELNEKGRATAEKRMESLAETGKELETQIKILRQQVSESEIAAAKIPALKMSLEGITRSGKRIADIEKIAADIQKLEDELPLIEKNHAASASELEKLGRARDGAEERWRKGQAALLAAGLKNGEPCPVCGSTHHPAPSIADDGIPGADEIEKLKADEKKADENVRSLEKEIVKKRAEIESMKAGIPSADELPEEHRCLTREDLKKKFRDESAELDMISGLSSALDLLKGKLQDCEKKLADEAAESGRTAISLRGIELKLAELGSRRHQMLSGLPEGISSLSDLTGRIEFLIKRVEELSHFTESAEKEWKDASEKYSTADAIYKRLSQDSRSAKGRLEAKELEFTERLRKEGFRSESELAEILQGINGVKELEVLVDSYKKEFISAKGRMDRAAAAIKGAERPDLALLSLKAESIRTEIALAIGKMKSAESEAERLDRIVRKIRLIESSASAEEEAFGMIQHLADIAGGKNSRKLTFQRYVLQSLFDEVLMMASGRLEMMSRGRYRLISPGRIGDRRLAGGLDLEVFDEYTGYSRPVVTLSGGEAFLASLSLALGLADLVQQYAGGIHLDTVFIDEGFGSLDSETLDLAINTLIDLQSSGRLVGIISHVNELRERIEARLEVIPVACGSTTRFVV